jgi:cell division protein FtsW
MEAQVMQEMNKKIGKGFFIDLSILLPFLILTFIGLVMVFSATSYDQVVRGGTPEALVIRQGIWALFGLVSMALIYRMKTSVFSNKRFINIMMFTLFIIIVITLLFAAPVNGARGWLSTPMGTLQPAEYLKIMFPLYFAVALTYKQQKIARHDWSDKLSLFLFPAIQLGLIVVTPDIGNATVLMLVTIAMILASGIAYRYAYAVLGLIIGGSTLLIEAMILSGGAILPKNFTYVYTRFLAMSNTFAPNVFSDAGHQLGNAYIAIHNGGWFGLGLGNSIQKRGFLPEAHTDFIFAITLEELGLIGGMLILSLLMFMICRMYLVSIRAQKPFNSLLSFGLATFFLVSVFVNVGGFLGMIPSTGITFPFLSLGGNSLFVFSVATGLVLNVSADEARLRLDQHVQYQHQMRMQQNG